MAVTSQSFLDASIERTAAGVSWGAVFAGAVAAAALSLILIVLGIGLGVSAISPWPQRGLGASALGASSIAWLVLTQIVASGVGGYLAGRLRIKWATVHTDEVYFRDTAHGFLSWAVAALVVASLIGGTVGNVRSSGASAGAALTATSATAAAATTASAATNESAEHNASSPSSSVQSNREGTTKYLVDSLFRAAPSAPSAPSAPDASPESDAAVRVEAERIFANSIHSASLYPQDQQYLAQVVARRTGLSAADADKRVSDTFTIVHNSVVNAEQRARLAADKVRKAAANSALWMFVSLLFGAFVASLAATLGGKQRDEVVHISAGL